MNDRTLIFRVRPYRTVLTYRYAVLPYRTVPYHTAGTVRHMCRTVRPYGTAVWYGQIFTFFWKPKNHRNAIIWREKWKKNIAKILHLQSSRTQGRTLAELEAEHCSEESRTLAAVPYGRTVRPYGTGIIWVRGYGTAVCCTGTAYSRTSTAYSRSLVLGFVWFGVKFSLVWFGVRFTLVWFGARFSLVWFGLVLGLVWFGLIWCWV